MAVNLSHLYLNIVSDVIDNVRPDFLNEGIDEAVLQNLKSSWEENMIKNGTIKAGKSDDPQNGTDGHPPIAPVHDLNMPYEGETPTAELLFPPTPVHTPLPTQMPTPSFMLPNPSPAREPYGSFGIGRSIPSPAHEPYGSFGIGWSIPSPAREPYGSFGIGRSIGPSPAHEPINSFGMGRHMPSPVPEPINSFGTGRPVSFMHPPWMNQRVAMNHNMEKLDMNVAYQAGDEEEAFTSHFPITQEFLPTSAGKRKREDFFSSSFFPQFDGSGDQPEGSSESAETKKNAEMEAWKVAKEEFEKRMAQFKQLQNRIPQYDGIGDNYDNGIEEEDYNEIGDEEQYPVDEVELKPAKCETMEPEDSEPLLNEDDDLDDLDDIIKGDEEDKTDNLVLAQFDKVTRSKNKWKCTLKDGVLHLQNRDILFSRATGEFDF